MNVQLPFVDRFLEAAASRVGAPYIWAGKGGYRIDAQGLTVPLSPFGYDCSGLVTSSLHEAGYNDHRNNWNAQAMFDQLGQALTPRMPCLAFFGGDAKSIHHVCICLEEFIDGWVLEAAGGDQTTLSAEPGKRVYFHRGAFWGPAHCQGYRALPAVQP